MRRSSRWWRRSRRRRRRKKKKKKLKRKGTNEVAAHQEARIVQRAIKQINDK